MVVSESSTQKNPVEWLVDLCVYAPIGFALDAHRYVPEFVERGRSQMAVARTLGKFAVDRLERQFPPLATVLDNLGLGVEDDGPPADGAPGAEGQAEDPARAGGSLPAVGEDPTAVAAPDHEVDATGAATDDVPGEDGLAIPGYASLAASQVVPRLASLDRAELAAIRRYESAHRARRTVLNRVDQLLARSG